MKSAALLVAATMFGVSTARADTIDDDDGPPRYTIAFVESAIAFAIPTIFYARDHDHGDIDLGWDWESWEDKLSGSAIRFDTNKFNTNATNHPLFSVINYHIGRTNNFGMAGSTLICIENIILWEFFVEFAEYPSVNDLIINAVTGVEIGEPLYQIGQLWRGGEVTVGDRLRTAVFSPIDAMHDAFPRKYPRWWRREAWRSIVLEAGSWRRVTDGAHGLTEVTLTGDIDIVSDRHFVSPGEQDGRIKAGSWSRIRGQVRFGDTRDSSSLSAVRLQTRTAFGGHYRQYESGTGQYFGAGGGFTYRQEMLPAQRDRVALAHLVGPQLQLSRRTPSLAVRLDLAGYADFGFMDAHAFEANPFPQPPPYTNVLAAQGYYDAAGITGNARFRVDSPSWSFDTELDAHRVWQIDAPDREKGGPHGASDARVYLRTQLAYRFRQFGVGAIAEGNLRDGTFKNVKRTTYEHVYGVLGQLAW